MDNDGDGLTDSVWVDLGYPARRNAQGQLYKPLFAFMVIGLNGRIPLNTAGNLAGGRRRQRRRPTRPTWATRSARSTRPTGCRTGSCSPTTPRGRSLPGLRRALHRGQHARWTTAGIDVRLTQLRNLLAGTRPQPNPGVPGSSPGAPDPTGQINGDNNFVADQRHQPYFMPNGIADRRPTSTMSTPTARARRCWGSSAHAARGGPVGRGAVGARLPDRSQPQLAAAVPQPGQPTSYNNRDPRRLLAGHQRLRQRHPPRRRRRQLQLVRPLPAARRLRPAGRGRRPRLPRPGRGYPAARRADAAVRDPGRHQRHRAASSSGTASTRKAGPDLGADQWGRVEYTSYFRPPGLPGQVAPTPAGGRLTTGGHVPLDERTSLPDHAGHERDCRAPLASTLLEQQQPAPRLRGAAVPEPELRRLVLPNPQRAGGVPVDLHSQPRNLRYLPGTLPTYDARSTAR